jgi:hypothetical protein
VPPKPPIPPNSVTVPNRHPRVAEEKPDRYGFYIPPSIGKSEIIRNIPRPVYVDAITTPNPPSFQKEPIPSADEVRGFLATQNFTPDQDREGNNNNNNNNDARFYSTPSLKLRSIRKTMTSNGKVGDPESFVVNLTTNIRNVRKIRLVSLVASYVVPAELPLVGYVYLRDFPLEGKQSFYETADSGQKYTGVFPILSGTIGATVDFAYAFPYCCYEMPVCRSDHTIEFINVDVLHENPITNPGTIVPFDSLLQFMIEIEFFIEDV